MALYVQKLMYVCTPPGLWAQFHQRSKYRFYARGTQKRKKDSQVISLFTFLWSTSVKAERKYVGEIDTWVPF